MDNITLAVILGAFLHGCFAILEMLPWHCPAILALVQRKKDVQFSGEQLRLTATIVRNAGIYNAIVAAGFMVSLFPETFGLPSDTVHAFRCFFFSGALVAGLFGLTLSPFTLVQAVLGGAGLLLEVWK
jgi:uncharacterized membrane protein